MRGSRARRRAVRGAVVAAAALMSLAFASTAGADSFIVLYKANAVPASARADIQGAGGSLVYAYNQIGVAVARSESASFATRVAADNRVEGVSSTAGFASRLQE